MKRKNPFALLLWHLVLAAASLHGGRAADSPPAGVSPQPRGVIEGRVFNPLTKEYIRNAEVSVQGSDRLAVTGGDGRYQILDVPAGAVTVAVTYTGYLPSSLTLAVRAGQVARADFDLQSASAQPGEKTIELDRFTVSSRREGTAKAIMEQRNSMNVKNIIASDTFGDMIEGNIAEVMQYMPGMAIQYDGGDPFTLQMRGMASRYGSLMVDGIRTSSSGGAPNTLTNSANAADTIEFTKTNSPDMDADAPAGTVNLKSKSAFQRKGRFFSYQLFGLVNSYQLHLGKSDGPNDGQTYKTLPGVILDYSDIYLDGKLGVVVNLSETHSSNEQAILRYTYDTTPTPANPAPILITTINYTNGPKVNRQQGGGLNVQYNLRPGLVLALRGSFTTIDSRIYNRQVQLISNRASQAPGSSATTMIANPTATNATRVIVGAGVTTMRTSTKHTIAPSPAFEGKKTSFDATVSYSRSGTYSRNGRLGGDSASFAGSTHQLFGVGFTATRNGPGENAWTFRQDSGPDIYRLSNYRATSSANNLTRVPQEPVSKQLVGQANAKFTPGWKIPTFFKTGVKAIDSSFFSTNGSYSWTYIGPENNRLTAELPVSVYRYLNVFGGNLFTQNTPQFLDKQALGALQKTRPEYFVANPSDPTNATNLFSDRFAEERIYAGYLMANSRLGRLAVERGMRYENTGTRTHIYERGVLTKRSGKYDDLFVSGSARYRFTDSLMTIASFSQSIARVNLSNLSGVATFNENNLTGTIPNPDLKPEHGMNYSLRTEYYFEPVGVFAVGGFMMDVKDLQFATSGVPAEEIGLGRDYAGYLFSTTRNVGSFNVKGFELEYTQQLTFLPGVLRGLGVFGNYARTKFDDPAKAFGQPSQTASGGVSFRYLRLNAALRASWTPDTLASNTTYNEARTMLGLSLGYQLTRRTSLFMTGRNILNAPINIYRRDIPGLTTQGFKVGSNWTFGIKGTF